VFRYFGYGSNLDITSLRAKGVDPSASVVGELRGWRLRFNVAHFFRHEGGVANIERTGDPADRVLGLVHDCDDAALALLDAAEAYPYGYDRVAIDVTTELGVVGALAYVGTPAFLDDSCRPSQRYLNIVVRGACVAGLDAEYVEQIRMQPSNQRPRYPPWVAPGGPCTEFTLADLGRHPSCTGLAGSVFDMSQARVQHDHLRKIFGGRDMTLFHLQRMDTSAGNETIADVIERRLTDAQCAYLNEYLHEYSREYRYVGTVAYA
jgi:hypothetical protein